MDPLQWMGAVRTRVQTADKNFTANTHNTSKNRKAPQILTTQPKTEKHLKYSQHNQKQKSTANTHNNQKQKSTANTHNNQKQKSTANTHN